MTFNEIGVSHVLIVSGLLFTIGALGFFINRHHLIRLLLSIELMLMAVNLNFVAFSAHLQEISGQIFSLFILTVSAAEIAIGLAILVLHFRNRSTIEMKDLSLLKE